MVTADIAELIAEFIYRAHKCGSDCPCWELRKIPEVKYALQKVAAELKK
jgi:hypothetical protein